MYRTAPPGVPPPDDPLYVAPGDGLRGIWVGRAVPDDVLRVFGADGIVNRHDSGEPFAIDYDRDEHDVYSPDRPAQLARPGGFRFEFGLLRSIDIGVHQDDLFTVGGLRIRSSRADVLRALGDAPELLHHEGFDSLRYLEHGIELSVSEPFGVSGWTVFRARR
jgi:hypothetical protein